MTHSIAVYEQEQCLAFSRRDHRRCRLKKMQGQRTCKTHKHYYDDWFLRHPAWYRRSWLSQRELYEYSFQLSKRHVLVPEVHVRGLQPNFEEYYRFLVQQAAVPVSWNTHCLSSCLKHILKRLSQGDALAAHEVTVFLNGPEDCYMVLQCLLYSWVRVLIEHYQEHGSWISYEAAFSYLFACMTCSNAWLMLFHSLAVDTLFLQRATNLHVEGSLLHTVDVLYIQRLSKEYIPRFKHHCRQILKTRVNQFKEELMQVTWHPRRIEAYMNLGIDIWDM